MNQRIKLPNNLLRMKYGSDLVTIHSWLMINDKCKIVFGSRARFRNLPVVGILEGSLLYLLVNPTMFASTFRFDRSWSLVNIS